MAVPTPHDGLTSGNRIWTDGTSTITTQRSQTLPELGESHAGSASHLADRQDEKKEVAQHVFHRQVQSCLEVKLVSARQPHKRLLNQYLNANHVKSEQQRLAAPEGLMSSDLGKWQQEHLASQAATCFAGRHEGPDGSRQCPAAPRPWRRP